MADKPLIVGESNPYGADPQFALYPAPDGCSGHRLCCLILGMHRAAYMESFERVNLCAGKWSAPAARNMARELVSSRMILGRPAPKFVLLGVIASVLGPALAWACATAFKLPGGSVVGLLGGALTSAATLALSVFAAGAAIAQPAKEASVEEVVITGSRLQVGGFTAPTPVTEVGREQFEQRAAASVCEGNR